MKTEFDSMFNKMILFGLFSFVATIGFLVWVVMFIADKVG